MTDAERTLAEAQRELEERRARLGLARDGADPDGLIRLESDHQPRLVIERTLKRMQEQRRQMAERAAGFKAGDVGRIRRAQPPQLTADEREQRRRDWLAWCGVPPAYLAMTRDAWDEKRHRWPKRLMAWRGRPWCLVFVGDPGTGKTHAAVALLQEWVKLRLLTCARGGLPRLARFVSVPRAVDELRVDYSRPLEKRVRRHGLGLEEWLDRVATFYELVIYDDVGAQPDRDTWAERVNGWLYARHQQAKPTIVTGNLDAEGKLVGVTDRIARRIVGDGKWVVRFGE